MDHKTFYDMTYGLFVLGVLTPEGKPTGCTVNTVFQITSQPPTLAISVNHANYTNEIIKKTGKLSVNILSQEVPMDTIGTFGFRSGREVDKFAQVPHIVVESGVPVLTQGVCGHFVCRVVNQMELSTHTLFIAEVTEGWRTGMGKVPPMTYAYYHQVKNGTEPKTAPTYLPQEAASGGGTYVCDVCKYEYNGDVPFEDLPDDWVCPLCKAPKSKFSKK